MDSDELKYRYEHEKESIRFYDYFDGLKIVGFLRLQKHEENNPIEIDNYPYGFKRTKIRYWIETTTKGDRFCSQTLNPKTEQWNKPKKSTYSDVMILVGDENGYVTYISVCINDKKSKAQAILSTFKDALSDTQIKRLHAIIGWDKAMENVEYKVHEGEMTEEEKEEQRKIRQTINKIAAYEAEKSYRDIEDDLDL